MGRPRSEFPLCRYGPFLVGPNWMTEQKKQHPHADTMKVFIGNGESLESSLERNKYEGNRKKENYQREKVCICKGKETEMDLCWVVAIGIFRFSLFP